LVGHPTKEEGIGSLEVLDRVTMHVFVRDPFTMIAAAVQCDVDGIPKGSHDASGGGLRLPYWVAQVCNADARDHGRVAKDGWRAGEAVEESNSGAKKNCRDVDVDFVEEAGIQQLLDGVGAVDPNGLSGGGGFGLVHGAFDAVGHEVDS
jgi:hypothetical protein